MPIHVPVQAEHPGNTAGNWSARPWAARVVRAVVFVVPVMMSIVAAWWVSDIVPSPSGFGFRIVRWIAIAGVSTFVLMGVDRIARRLLPLATLFGLTLAFPDQAPSRFKMALRNGTTAQLRQRVEDARSGRAADTPAESAERVLELVMALSHHDRLTRGHSERVRAYTQMIGEEMGLTAVELDRLRWSGLLHDIGKLRVSGAILNKPGKLTDAEFEEIKRHPEHGRTLVAPLVDWLGDSSRAVWEHHERWDGRGYPSGLRGTEISLAGRIVAVADTFDVITSVRSYKQATSPAAARAELTRCSGSQFDPAVVRAFMNLSLGRLRLAMGPLSWLAQVPLFPQALTAAATGAAPAATALVGAAAATMGLGLSSDPFLPPSRTAVAESTAFDRDRSNVIVDDVPTRGTTPIEVELPGTSSVPGDTATSVVLITAPGATAPTVAEAVVATSAPTIDDDARLGVTTTTVPSSRSAATTAAPASAAATTTTAASTNTNATAAPTTTGGPTTSTTTTSAATTTTATTTVATTTTAVPTTTAATTTTVPPRPAWLPPPNAATAYYFDLPSGGVDLAAEPLLTLSRTVPSGGSSPDADGDGKAGVSLVRDGDPVVFALTAPTAARVTGSTTAVVHVGATGLLQTSVSVRAQLMVCDAAGACSVVSDRTASTLTVTPLVALPVNIDFGVVDVTIPISGTLRIAIAVPASSAGDGVLLSDTSLTPSAITLRFP